MKANYTIEKLNPNDTCKHHFVLVYKNGEYIGSCLTDGTLSPFECAQSVYNNREIDRLEGLEDARINASLDY